MSSARRVIPLIPIAAASEPGVEPALKIQPRAVTGLYSRWRWLLVWLTQAVFVGLPWLNWGGHQAVLFDLEARRFYLFGAVLLPQDLVYLTGLLVFCALLLFFATAVAGRVWCGFACPQTVYTEMFMWIEHRAEGDRLARLRWDAAPWSLPALRRRSAKHLGWLLLSLLTGFSLVAWFTPVRPLAGALLDWALGPWEAFWMLFYGAITYLHAGVLREKICQHACPYGRFQGSMLDARTLVVSYDVSRGEPRGARARGVAPASKGQGDCVDCTLCVQVCPVGIDIRQGLQSACISCGVCIDACDRVMDKLAAPRGLIRFAAMQDAGLGPGGLKAALWRPRAMLYGGGLLILAMAMTLAWSQRPELRLNAMRDRSVLVRPVEDGAVENVYRLQVMNASLQAREIRLSVVGQVAQAVEPELEISHSGPLRMDPAGAMTVVVTVRMSARQQALHAGGGPLPIRFVVQDVAGGDGAARAETLSTFLAG
ncbi:cytochrome c oxidase accessory protein CcoG [Ideonella sp.]|uniref:cytochrome c oxidase accessory protein CcoG n=1 Tax=Ideonella sp. TaxID=1929293 RepID=UPI003BB5F8E6